MIKVYKKNKRNFRFSQSKGEAIIVIVLVMVVALTIGLSIAGRSTTDIKMSTQVEESQRAFSAAEAGIESAIYSGLEGTDVSIGNASYSVKINPLEGSEFVFPKPLVSDEVSQVWLVSPEEPNTELYSGDSFKIAWGNPNANWAEDINTPAIEATIIYKEGNLYKFGKYALDPRTDRNNSFCLSNGTNCSGVSNWNTDGETIAETRLQFSADLSLPNAGKICQLLRIRLLYNNNEQLVGVKALSGGSFPSQGKLIESTGVAGETTRKVKVFEFNPSLPEGFDYSLLTSEDLEK